LVKARRKASRRFICIIALPVLVIAALGPIRPAHGDDGLPQGIAASAFEQIRALIAEKGARTGAQRKIDSNLLAAYRQAQDLPMASGAGVLDTGIELDATDSTIVDITAHVGDGLLSRLETLGATIISAYPAFRSVRASVPIDHIQTIAGWEEVIFVQPRQEGVPAGHTQPERVRPGRENSSNRTERVQGLPYTFGQMQGTDPGAAEIRPIASQAITLTSAINRSEGNVAHRADVARATYGHIGLGVKVCVLSDGVNTLADLQASGDLPPAVTVVPGQAGNGDEGSAMLEIVHDLAPGAQLYFATAAGGIAGFAQNIRDLREIYGCDIIIDDYTYFAESPFQLGQAPGVVSFTNAGLLSEAVEGVTASGALFFSSAGNSGNLNDGTSGVWEGDFADGGASAAPIPYAGTLHDFDPGVATSAFNTVTVGTGTAVSLSWADPLGGSGNDYDLFVLNAAGTAVVAASTNVQSGTQDPLELIGGAALTGRRIVVLRSTGAANRYLHVNTNRGRLAFATAGQVYGHNAAVNALTTAAAFAQQPPVPFGGATTVETFSSDGPRRHFFSSDGTPFTPGDFSSTGGAVMPKPDLTAADGVSCAAPGFNGFFGTSAAAPHAGAIAALIRSANPDLTPAQIRTILTSSPGAIDIEAAGPDRDSGAGALDALAAMQTMNPSPVPLLVPGHVVVVEGALRNGNGAFEPGETGDLVVPLSNPTLADAAGVSLTLALLAPPPGVKLISASTISYGDLSAGSSASNAGAPFVISIAPEVTCGTQVNYVLTAVYGGGGNNSPQTMTGNLVVGKLFDVTTTLDGTPPPSEPGLHTASTGTQTGRLNRNGVTATCAGQKVAPPLQATTDARQYDSYLLTNTLPIPTCVSVTLSQGVSLTLFSAAYNAGGFVPRTPNANYLADPGYGATQNTYSFVVAGGQPFTVVVHEVNPGGGGQQYGLAIRGLGIAQCDAPPPQPATIAATAGNGQSVLIGMAFPTELQATVRDSGDAPVPGVEVAFAAPTSGASGAFPNGNTAITDAGGRASVRFTANEHMGSYVVTANTTNPALAAPAGFTLTNATGLTISPSVLPEGRLVQPYAQTLTASGGTGAGYAFAVTAGVLPPGLSLSASGMLGGTPVMRGIFNFAVTVSDSVGNTSQRTYSMSVVGGQVYAPVAAQ
jgi:hypothetical protein